MKKYLFLIAFFGFLLGCGSLKKGGKAAPPNVLFIIIDDLRPELNSYKKTQIISPNIDLLANEGHIFKRAYCQNPVCGASRASILSGLRPTFDRFWDYQSQVDKDAPGTKTLPQAFKENGYYTLSNGKVFHILSDSDERSWSEPAWRAEGQNGRGMLDEDSKNYIGGLRNRGPFFESPDVPDNAYPDGKILEKSVADLKRLSQMRQPFFFAVGFTKPHLPFYAPKKYWDLYDQDTIQIAENRERPVNAPDELQGSTEIRFYHDRNIPYNSDDWHKTARHGYYACVSYVDAMVGKLLAALDGLGLKENTIVVLIGDHGWNLGEHNFWGKHNTMHPAVNAPLIMRVPGKTSGRQSEALVEFVDIYPTLCELSGIPVPQHVQGKSLIPLLEKPDQPWKKAVFSRYHYGDAVITEKYIYTEYKKDSIESSMLYDLEKDKGENINVVDQPAYQEVVKKLHKYLKEISNAS
ncbi:MAG: sulfatase [Lewinellaceae bacterium]|nr:sulfatase [Lewinellaceae bacterium]